MIRARNDIRGREWLIALLVSLIAGLLMAFGGHVPSLLPAWAWGVVLTVAALFTLVHSLSRCRASLRLEAGFSHLGSAAFGGGVLLAVVLPGFQSSHCNFSTSPKVEVPEPLFRLLPTTRLLSTMATGSG